MSCVVCMGWCNRTMNIVQQSVLCSFITDIVSLQEYYCILIVWTLIWCIQFMYLSMFKTCLNKNLFVILYGKMLFTGCYYIKYSKRMHAVSTIINRLGLFNDFFFCNSLCKSWRYTGSSHNLCIYASGP